MYIYACVIFSVIDTISYVDIKPLVILIYTSIMSYAKLS